MAILDNSLAWIAVIDRSASIRDAARALDVAPSTLYRRLDRAEASLGVTLFDRRRDSLRVTPAGQRVIDASTRIDQALADLRRDLVHLGSAITGRVVVSVPEALALPLLDPLTALKHRHPGLEVQLQVGPGRADVHKGEADLVVRVSADPGDTLVGRRLGRVELAVYGTESPADDAPFDPAAHDWVCFSSTLASTAQARWEHAHVPADRVVMRVPSRTLFFEAVCSGVGVGLLPCALADRRPALVRLTEPFSDDALTLWVLAHPAAKGLPGVRLVMDTLVSTLRLRSAPDPH